MIDDNKINNIIIIEEDRQLKKNSRNAIWWNYIHSEDKKTTTEIMKK